MPFDAEHLQPSGVHALLHLELLLRAYRHRLDRHATTVAAGLLCRPRGGRHQADDYPPPVAERPPVADCHLLGRAFPQQRSWLMHTQPRCSARRPWLPSKHSASMPGLRWSKNRTALRRSATHQLDDLAASAGALMHFMVSCYIQSTTCAAIPHANTGRVGHLY